MKISDFTSPLPYVGKRSARKRLNEIFSRQMLGSVLVGATASKIVEKLIILATGSVVAELVAWIIAFHIAIFVFVYWERLERAAKASSDDAKNVADKAKEKVKEATDEKKSKE